MLSGTPGLSSLVVDRRRVEVVDGRILLGADGVRHRRGILQVLRLTRLWGLWRSELLLRSLGVYGGCTEHGARSPELVLDVLFQQALQPTSVPSMFPPQRQVS